MRRGRGEVERTWAYDADGYPRGICDYHSFPVVCGVCGIKDIEHISLPSPTYHYEDQQVNGYTIRTPVMDGHFFRPVHRVNGRDHPCGLD